ncbi:MAG: hypothetical protein VYD54_06370 [Bdellovibrionota bacterium]|nr:hypothetical protein [Bdellovibrionota bacterium]
MNRFFSFLKITIVTFLFTHNLNASNSQYDKIAGYNSPWRFLKNHSAKFEELPLEGKLEDKPWSGDYWADFLGGTSYRWFPMPKDKKDKTNPVRFSYNHPTPEELKKMDLRILSPAEKYDLFMGDKNWTMTKTERERTGVLKTVKGHPQYDSGFKVEGWWGLCHAWAPATVLYKNPSPITLKNPQGIKVPFGASDIKALISLHMHTVPERSQEYTFLGERCYTDLKAIFAKWQAVWDREATSEDVLPALRIKIRKGLDDELKGLKECNDMNPGSFHIALGNSIGHNKKGFVMDKDRGGETWNQGVYGYNAKIVKTRTEKVKEENHTVYTIENTVHWVTEIPQSWKRVKDGVGLTNTTYIYDLFVNSNGFIVGGKWLTQGLMDRPDIIWMRRPRPAFNRGLPGLENLYSSSLKVPVKRFSKGDLKSLFKKSVRKIINAQKFIKGSKQLVARRKELRRQYYDNLKKTAADAFFDQIKTEEQRDKKILKALAPKIASARKKIAERNKKIEEAQNNKECLVTLFNWKGRFKDSFKAKGPQGCAKAKAKCLKKKRFKREMCLAGSAEKNNNPCTHELISRKGKLLGTFTVNGIYKDFNCKISKLKCGIRKLFVRKCVKK